MLIRFGDTPQLTQFGLLCNTEDAGLFTNVRSALARRLPEIELAPANGVPAVICGGGPSLADTLVNIRALKAQGAKIYALNNAAKFLTEHAIEVDAQILVDSRPQNVVFVEKRWAKELLLSSQCHPALYTQAADIGTPVRIWHPAIGGIDKVVTKGAQCFIGGGMTVGLCGACLVFVMGHREIHFFGYDSSHREKSSHAFAQPMNDAEEKVQCAVDSRVFDCSLAMAAQAHDFRNVRDMLEREGCKLHMHGEGLLPTLWNMWERERTQRIMQAVFDLGLYEPQEFGAFLKAAEAHRVAAKFDRMDIVFQPGPMFGFRNADPLPDTEERKELLWRYAVDNARLHSSVRSIEVLGERRTVTGDIYPEGYLEDSPKSHYPVPQEKTS